VPAGPRPVPLQQEISPLSQISARRAPEVGLAAGFVQEDPGKCDRIHVQYFPYRVLPANMLSLYFTMPS
jgi:hypothetical protein